MAVRFSTKLRNDMLSTVGFNGALGTATAIISIYSGVQPSSADDAPTGNLLLNQILDVKIHRVKDSSKRKELMQQLEMELMKKGKTPYIIPTGGSTKIGALGYLNCILEVKNQSNDIISNSGIII